MRHLDGPELVIAGAGSGKTRVLTYKIAYLLAKGHAPWRILALTFTNKAAKEMRERIESMAGQPTASKLRMGTFHSVFAKLLRFHADRLGYPQNFTIYDSYDSKTLIKSIIKDMNLDDKVYVPNAVIRSISTAKNALISPEDYANDRDLLNADRNAKRPETYLIYSNYVNRCRISGAMDFDDLLFNMHRLLMENPDIRSHYAEFFSYILVDEYQDTNYAQHRVIDMLCSTHGNLCVVGDDAQSIYSFRGANIRNILGLKKLFPELSTFKLEQNYRSTQNILNAANSLIARNNMQIPKKIFSDNGPGDLVKVFKAYSDFEEAGILATNILRLKRQTGDKYSDFAVLYRTNAQSRILEQTLRNRNIPYRIYGGLGFYQRKEVKDAVSYLRLALNPNDDEALKRIINTPARGIGETTVKKLVSAAFDTAMPIYELIAQGDAAKIGVNKGTMTKLSAFREIIEGMRKYAAQNITADKAVEKIIARSGLITSLVSDDTPENISRVENLKELGNAAVSFVNERREEGAADEELTLRDFLATVSLATDQDIEESDGESDDKITLMTIHAAKGLEFNNIMIVGVEEDLMPSSMSMESPEAIEEERRLMYVAITRARYQCYISYASERLRNGTKVMCRPSRFLGEINSAFLHFAMGTPVEANRVEAPSFERFISEQRNYGRQGYQPKHKPIGATSGIDINTQKRAQWTVLSDLTSSARADSGEFALRRLSEMKPGQRVAHQRFGNGLIISAEDTPAGEKVIVEFDNFGSKTLLLKFALLKLL